MAKKVEVKKAPAKKAAAKKEPAKKVAEPKKNKFVNPFTFKGAHINND
jgi:hypothetical protein